MVFDGQIETSKRLVLLLGLLARLVEQNLELGATAHIVQQFAHEQAQIVGQLQIFVLCIYIIFIHLLILYEKTNKKCQLTNLKVLLLFGESAQLVAELERGEHGIDACERDVRLAGEAAVGVETRLRVPQRVELEAVHALVAFAVEVVRPGDPVAADQQVLDDLDAVVLRGEHERRDVGRELRVIGARRLPERVGVARAKLLVGEHLVLGMTEYGLGYLQVAKIDGEQQRFAYLRTVRLVEQHLHDLEVLVLDGESQGRAAQVVRHVDVEVLDRVEDADHGHVVAVLARLHELLVDVELRHLVRRAGPAHDRRFHSLLVHHAESAAKYVGIDESVRLGESFAQQASLLFRFVAKRLEETFACGYNTTPNKKNKMLLAIMFANISCSHNISIYRRQCARKPL